MHRLLFALAFVIASITASAQGIIPFIGGNLSGYQVNQNKYASGGVPGFNLGTMADITLSRLFHLQPGLEYAMAGGKLTSSDTVFAATQSKYKYRSFGFQLPVMLVLKTGEKNHEGFFAGAGFYVGANLGGDVAAEVYTADHYGNVFPVRYSEELQFSSHSPHLQRFDFGLDLGMGYYMAAGPELFLFYQKGIVDMQLSHAYIGKVTTYQLGIAARYAFKWSPKHTHSNKYVNHK